MFIKRVQCAVYICYLEQLAFDVVKERWMATDADRMVKEERQLFGEDQLPTL